MITKEQALTENTFHADGCRRIVGPRGGVRYEVFRYRRNGKTKTWVRQPDAFRVPCKVGFRKCADITQANAKYFHVSSECPLYADLEAV